MTIRVLVADDQSLIRAGFRTLVESAADLVVVGEASDGREAVDKARTTRPDVVLMDIRMPGTDGLSATELITADPTLADVRVVILTTFESDDYIIAALRAGASGFLDKGVEPTELVAAIRTVAAGESLLSPKATSALIGRFLSPPGPGAPTAVDARMDALTGREREIVTLVGQGMSNGEVAEHLFLSPLTVKTHVNRSMTKLDARDRAQLVVLAYQSGLVKAGDDVLRTQ